METRNSLTKALQQMGFEKVTGKNRNETMAWQEKERAYLTKLCNEHGIEVEIKGEDKRKNLTVSEYKEAMQEVAAIKEQAVELSTEKELLLTDNARLEEANAGLENRHDELSAKIIALDEKVDKKKKSWDILEKKTVKLEEKHKKISDLDEALERNIHVYDESDKWQLSEPELLQTAKSYRDKSAKPLVDTLKKVVKDLTLRVIKLVEEVKEAKQLANRKSEDYKNLNARFHTIISERDYYKGRSDDLGIVEKSMGINRVQSIIRESKEAQEREKIIAKVEKKPRNGKK